MCWGNLSSVSVAKPLALWSALPVLPLVASQPRHQTEVLVWFCEPVFAKEAVVMLTLVEDVFHLSSQEAYQYNRENFLYDRALRRRKEFQVLLLMSGSAGISITRNLRGLDNTFKFPIFATQASKCFFWRPGQGRLEGTLVILPFWAGRCRNFEWNRLNYGAVMWGISSLWQLPACQTRQTVWPIKLFLKGWKLPTMRNLQLQIYFIAHYATKRHIYLLPQWT